jgi:uncharacterized membrane protein
MELNGGYGNREFISWAVAFALSFVIIARVWMSHHTDFFRIREFSSRLAWLNMLLLFFIVMLPATTSVLSDYGGNPNPWPSVLYAATIPASTSPSPVCGVMPGARA